MCVCFFIYIHFLSIRTHAPYQQINIISVENKINFLSDYLINSATVNGPFRNCQSSSFITVHGQF